MKFTKKIMKLKKKNLLKAYTFTRRMRIKEEGEMLSLRKKKARAAPRMQKGRVVSEQPLPRTSVRASPSQHLFPSYSTRDPSSLRRKSDQPCLGCMPDPWLSSRKHLTVPRPPVRGGRVPK